MRINNTRAGTVQSNVPDTRNSGGQTVGKHPATGGTVAWDRTAQGAGNRKNDFLSSNQTAQKAELHARLGARENNGALSVRHVAQKSPDWAPRARNSSANAKRSASPTDRRNAGVLAGTEQKFQLGGVHIHMKASFAGHETDLYERMRGQLAPTKQNSKNTRESVANDLASELWEKRGASTHRTGGEEGKAQFIAAATKDLLALYDARKMERYKEDGATILREPRKVGDMPSDGKPKGILRAPDAKRQTDKAVRFEGESDEASKARAARPRGDTKQEAFDVHDARRAYRQYVADLASGTATGLDELYPRNMVEKLAELNSILPEGMAPIALPPINLQPTTRDNLKATIKAELVRFDATNYERGALPGADGLKKRVRQEAAVFTKGGGFFKTLTNISRIVDLTDTQKAVVFWRAVNEMPAQLAQAMEDVEEKLEAKSGGLSPSKDVADEGVAFARPKDNPLTAALTAARRAFEEKWMEENINYVKANHK
ncbi:MAG: hypothetical protein ACR652_07125 [Methylocystis sp.]|uniref:hypothetical protein n=1 Tax=Methylocystis sp. TaxID=1911079 RepID=UPI003DA5AD15